MSSNESESLRLDEATLSNEENRELYLFQWLSNAEKALKSLNSDEIKAAQPRFEPTLVKLSTGVAPFPQPGRPLRNLVARSLVLLYTKGDTKTIYDVLQTYIRVAGDFKATDNDSAKTCALYCMGELMLHLSNQIASFVTDIAVLTLKIAKTSSLSLLLRYHAIITLRKSLFTSAKAATEQVTKDALKQARNLLSDKAFCIQRAASSLLVVLYPSPDPHRTGAEIESIVHACIKCLDSSDQPTRRSLALLAGHMLASSQTERAAAQVDTSKQKQKGKDKDKLDEDDIAPAPPISTEAPKMIMSLHEMFFVLSSQFNRPSTSRKTRMGIFDFYAATITALGPSWGEANYAAIFRHFVECIITYTIPRNITSRYDTLYIRHGVSLILRDLIAMRMLSEQGQIGAIRELANGYLKKWPALMPGEKAPAKEVLVIALREVSGLVAQMGNAPPPVQEALSNPLIQLLSHPSHAVRVASSWALRSFCFSTPLRLPKLILTVLELLQKDISSLASPNASVNVATRALGHAYGLSALFAVIPERPLYVSYDISAKVLDMATQLLKRASEHDLKVADVEIEIAWTSIASLMALGPNFVKAHLPQLLVLWRNALPKPSSKDTASGTGRTASDWMFLLHVRECALGAILAFLKHNSPTLVTLDVTRRLSSLLSNAVGFANAFQSQEASLDITEQMAQVGGKGVTPMMRESSLRSRAYQCFSILGFSTLTDSTQTTLIQGAIALFASHEGYAGSAMQAAIASSAGNAVNIWQVADEYGYGITSLASVTRKRTTGREGEEGLLIDVVNGNSDSVEKFVEQMYNSPVLTAVEHDTLVLCDLGYSKTLEAWPDAPPSTTAVVDSSIELFSKILPLQEPPALLKTINQLSDAVRTPKMDKNVGRKAAAYVNAVVAILMALRGAMQGTRQAKDNLGRPQVVTALSAFLKDAIIDGDPILRSAGSEALGRVASLAGSGYLAGQVKQLVDTVVSNRDPSARAGCALTFGAIHSYVGGLALGPLLKTTVNILMSLSTDPHPLVHYWALVALSSVINAASLSYSPFVSSTLGMLFSAYSSSTHEDGGGSGLNANLLSVLPTHQVICQTIDGVISVTGPELMESNRTRALIIDLVHELGLESDDGIKVEAIKCIQHYLLFTSDHVDMQDLVNQLRRHLGSSCRPLKLASINALYQLVQKDALAMSKMGGDQLVEDLFRMLDEDAAVDGVRNIILSWLQQTASLNPSAWIDLCQRIMSRTTASQNVVVAATKTTALHDDEGESLGIGLTDGKQSNNSTSRWRTQLFSLQCLHTICDIVGRSGRREHLDLVFARAQKIPTAHLLISRVPDLIKMAFTASAAYVTEIRLEGLVVLRDIIETFAASPDPDYSEAPLLEQHQAPITAALTPAFSSDSTPEILAVAVQVCGVFVGSGIIKEVGRMGRILKLLTSALEQSKDSGMLSIGDAKQLSPNASVMLRIATATAWAELESARYQRPYLNDVVGPHRQALASIWIASLRDYASIRGDSEMLQDTSSVAMESSYLALGREVLLPYYNSAWIPILKAVANAMTAQDPYVFSAMEGGEVTANIKLDPKRQEPSALFFVLFGLVYETLANSSADATSTSSSRENAIASLQALKSLVEPQLSGKALLEPTVFEELTALWYRMAMTEPASVQIHLVEVAAAFAKSRAAQLREANAKDASGGSAKLSLDSPLTHCLRTCAYVLRQNIPSAKNHLVMGEGNGPQDRVALLSAAFKACATVGQALGPSHVEEVRLLCIALYADILKDETCEWDLTGPTLPSLKAMLDMPSGARTFQDSTYSATIHGLLATCLTNIDDMRGRQGAISNMKIKNNLLACVLILTSVPAGLQMSRPAVEYCCLIIGQKLVDGGEVSLSAAHCCKTITLTSTSATCNPALKQCAQLLIPGMIRFVASIAAGEQETSPTSLHALGEVINAMTSFFSTLPEENRARMLGVIIPTLILLFEPQPSKAVDSPTHKLAVKTLLGLATSAPAAFREATGKLDGDRKTKLESVIREALADSGGGSAKAAKPTIALRSF